MYYSILHAKDTGESYTCRRCGRELSVAVRFIYDGELVTVGRECAKHFGIEWTTAYGPGAEDRQMLRSALDAQMVDRHNRWVMSYSERQAIREATGRVPFEMAWAVYNCILVRLGTKNTRRDSRIYELLQAEYREQSQEVFA